MEEEQQTGEEEAAGSPRREVVAAAPAMKRSRALPSPVRVERVAVSSSSVCTEDQPGLDKGAHPTTLRSASKPAVSRGEHGLALSGVPGRNKRGEVDENQQQSDGKPAKKKRRRGKKRKRREVESAKASDVAAPIAMEAQTKFLMQYACSLLRAQALDYEVRGREVEEKNTAQALEIERWETKVRKLKQQLHCLQYDESETTSASLETASTDTSTVLQASGRSRGDAALAAASIDLTDSLIPANVAAIEDKIQQIMRERTRKIGEFSQSLPKDFKETLEQQISRLVDVNRGALV